MPRKCRLSYVISSYKYYSAIVEYIKEKKNELQAKVDTEEELGPSFQIIEGKNIQFHWPIENQK